MLGWTFTGTTLVSHYLITAIFYGMVGLGSSCAYNAALSTNIRNFDQKQHGFAVGVPVSLFGLSALFFSTLSRLFQSSPPSVVLERRMDSTQAPAELNVPAFLMFVGVVTGVLTLVSGLYGLRERFPRRRSSQEVSVSSPTSPARENEDLSPVHSSPPTINIRSQSHIPLRSKLDVWEVIRSVFVSSVTTDPLAWRLFIPFMLLAGIGLMYINSNKFL